MTEQRRHAILFAATLLSARRLIESIQSDKPDLSKTYFVDKAMEEAAFVLEGIDKNGLRELAGSVEAGRWRLFWTPAARGVRMGA